MTVFYHLESGFGLYHFLLSMEELRIILTSKETFIHPPWVPRVEMDLATLPPGTPVNSTSGRTSSPLPISSEQCVPTCLPLVPDFFMTKVETKKAHSEDTTFVGLYSVPPFFWSLSLIET